jgi:hypothetical protein
MMAYGVPWGTDSGSRESTQSIRRIADSLCKWSPSWEDPYKITRIVVVTAYFVETLEGQELPKALNGKYLKWYYPSAWQGM